ncbi:MAG TPA: hypothetical protein VEZ26_02100, partial [Sphingomonadaceae bacterium]|nr:hypothetical protein [Sphingomonadaceae bacterium]
MDYSYKVGDEVVRLEVDPSVVAVKFADVSRSMASKAADRAGVGPFRPDYDIVGDGFALVPALGP